MAKEIFNRQELKYVIGKHEFDSMVADIAPHMQLDTYNKDGKTYPIYNLYIDTNDHALIRHSLTRPVYKEKLRIRSYEGFATNTPVFLEVKKRYKRITNKRRTKIPYDDALSFIESGMLSRKYDYMNPQVIHELEAMLRANRYYPKTFITYDRLAFSDKTEGSDLRVTFDTNLRTRRFGEDNEHMLLKKGQFIMEVKSTHNIPLWLVDILDRHDVHKQSFSKYGREHLRYLRDDKAVMMEVAYA